MQNGVVDLARELERPELRPKRDHAVCGRGRRRTGAAQRDGRDPRVAGKFNRNGAVFDSIGGESPLQRRQLDAGTGRRDVQVECRELPVVVNGEDSGSRRHFVRDLNVQLRRRHVVKRRRNAVDRYGCASHRECGACRDDSRGWLL